MAGSAMRPCWRSASWRAWWRWWRSPFNCSGAEMELGVAVLDQHVIDRNGIPMGRVDGVVLQLWAGSPPRVARIVVGGPTLLRRISPVLAGWAERWRRRWGPSARGGVEV